MKQAIRRYQKNFLYRPLCFLASMGLVFGLATAVVEAGAAGGQVQFRSIRMSDSGVSGGTITSGVGSGTNVTYRVSFTAATSYTIQGLVVDFCSGTGGTPFIGDSNCPAPTSFTVGASPTIDTTAYTDHTTGTPVSYSALSGTWTAGSLNSGQTFYMTNGSGASVTAGTKYSFAISGITNPSALGSFYARLLTYTTTAGATGYSHGTPGSYQDYGGFALSTANIVQVTAKVQETITFCVSGAAFTVDCATGVTAPAIILGHGSNNTLDGSQVDTNSVYTLTSTNALHGVSIRMHNAYPTCGGLSSDGGTTCPIPAANAGAGTAGAITPGTAAFGLFCANSTNLGTGTGSITGDTNYNDGTSTDYGMDTTTAGANIEATYGDQIASSTGPVSSATNQLTFAATAASTTPAGIYTTNLAMIATGTF